MDRGRVGHAREFDEGLHDVLIAPRRRRGTGERAARRDEGGKGRRPLADPVRSTRRPSRSARWRSRRSVPRRSAGTARVTLARVALIPSAPARTDRGNRGRSANRPGADPGEERHGHGRFEPGRPLVDESSERATRRGGLGPAHHDRDDRRRREHLEHGNAGGGESAADLGKDAGPSAGAWEPHPEQRDRRGRGHGPDPGGPRERPTTVASRGSRSDRTRSSVPATGPVRPSSDAAPLPRTPRAPPPPRT